MVDREPTAEIDPREITIAYLQDARESWLTARYGAERAGGMSAALNSLEAEALAKVDRLLEELSALGSTAIQASQS